MTDSLSIASADDFHAHFRRGAELRVAAALSAAGGFARALAMPNVLPPPADGPSVAAYLSELSAAAPGFSFLGSFKILPRMGRERVAACAAAGAIAGKWYPSGATTNADDGIADPAEVEEELAAMEELGLVLCVHAEEPSAPVLDREAAYLPVIERLLSSHPALRVVMEHVSSREGLAFVLGGGDRLAGTVTAHHLLYTLDDLMGGGLSPHLHCKPCLKRKEDRDALRDAVYRGEPRLFFGSDSAPHARAAKEGPLAPSGIFSSPVALPLLASLFDSEGVLESLEPFVSRRGADFYRLPRNEDFITLVKDEWTVPEAYGNFVPLHAGKPLAWRMEAKDAAIHRTAR